MKLIIIILLIAVLITLGAGLVFLVKDSSKDRRLLTSLAIRVGLSLLIFILLIGGYLLGFIQPHGVIPR